MAPVHLALLGDDAARVPVVADPFWIGRDPACDLCLWDLRISRKHARVSRAHGEYILSSEGRHGVHVNGKRAPVITLRDGDEIQLTPPGEPRPIRLRFENQMEGTFVPPEASLSAGWYETARARGVPPGILDRYEVLGTLGGGGPGAPRLARQRSTGRRVVLYVRPPVAPGPLGDRWLRFVAAVGGAEHPALARVLDGGIDPVEEGLLLWMATTFVRGRTAEERIPEGPQTPVTAVRRMRALAGALQLLHGRGVVHGGVTPSHVVLVADGTASLVGYGRSHVLRDGPLPGAAPVSEEPFVAPEVLAPGGGAPTPASDVYGLAAVFHALLGGRPPFGAESPRGDAPALVTRGVIVPHALEDVILHALSPDPARRPSAEDVGQVLAFVEQNLPRGSFP